MKNLPELKTREEMINILSQQAYGYMPAKFGETTCKVTTGAYNTAAGKGSVETLEITADTGNGLFSFPVRLIINKTSEVSPIIILINFRPEMYDEYCPVEEILDNGFSIAQICYSDITSDDDAYSNGLSAYYPKNTPDAPGKISLWAWALSRVIDVIENDCRFDRDNIAVIGHSRLGKTALWCAVNDERVKFVHSNDSGSMGASLEYNKCEGSENRYLISVRFPWWFCNRFNENISSGFVDESFDQHFLIASVSPRFVSVTSAYDDLWADPENEYNSCRCASSCWNSLGFDGIVTDDIKAVIGQKYNKGRVAYKIRKGPHYLSREDWDFFMNFIKSNIDC